MKNILPFAFLLSLAAAALLPLPAAAQDGEALEPAKKMIGPTTPELPQYDNLPEQFIQEANSFHNQCSTGSLGLYFNCKCLATKYLDKRIELGPRAQASIIKMRIVKSTDCADASGIAGYEYESCRGQGVLTPANIPVDEYCACFATTFAKLFEKSGLEPGTMGVDRLKTQAYVTCENPALGKSLYSSPPR